MKRFSSAAMLLEKLNYFYHCEKCSQKQYTTKNNVANYVAITFDNVWIWQAFSEGRRTIEKFTFDSVCKDLLNFKQTQRYCVLTSTHFTKILHSFININSWNANVMNKVVYMRRKYIHMISSVRKKNRLQFDFNRSVCLKALFTTRK